MLNLAAISTKPTTPGRFFKSKRLNIDSSMFHNLRMLTITGITITEILFLVACHSNAGSVKKDDTTAALQVLLDSAFYKHRLAIAAQAHLSDSLRDTIIIKRNDILVHHLPKNLLHKLLTEDEMCELMPAHQTSNLQFIELE